MCVADIANISNAVHLVPTLQESVVACIKTSCWAKLISRSSATPFSYTHPICTENCTAMRERCSEQEVENIE